MFKKVTRRVLEEKKCSFTEEIKIPTYKVYLKDAPTSIFFIKLNDVQLNHELKLVRVYKDLIEILRWNNFIKTDNHMVASNMIKYYELYNTNNELITLDMNKKVIEESTTYLFFIKKKRILTEYENIEKDL